MEKYIFALGFFDGVHLGHQALLSACCRLAAERGCGAAAITFDNHPQAAFTTAYPPLLCSLPDRLALLSRFGMDRVLTLPATKDIMSTPWQAFLEDLLAEGAIGFVCGDDFRFGHRGQGDGEKLRAFCAQRGLPCVIVPEQSMDGVRISSTRIRRLVEAGDMAAAAKFLGHPHVLSGKVVSGRQLGRTIGVPTANVLLPEGVAVPRLGVYACTCRMAGERYSAVTNVGSRPTVDGHQIRAESWLLDFAGDLYGREITLEFYQFLRPEEKFADLEALRSQIQADAAQAKLLLR